MTGGVGKGHSHGGGLFRIVVADRWENMAQNRKISSAFLVFSPESGAEKAGRKVVITLRVMVWRLESQ